MTDRLALSHDEILKLGRATLEQVAAYYDDLPQRPVLVPTTSQALRELLEEPLPQAGADFGELLDTIRAVIGGFSRHSGHPRFFGYISAPGTPVTSLASLLTSTYNINVTCWRSGPAATELEHVTIQWLKE